MTTDDLPAIIGGIVALLLLGLTGSCVHDWAKSTPAVAEVVVVDKKYSPEYYTTSCTSDNRGNTSCHPVYHGPSWSVQYQDGNEIHSTSVSSGTYEALKLGDRKILRYNKGGGYWQARYSEKFIFGATAEAKW